MKITALIALFAIVALVQSAPTTHAVIPAGTTVKKVHTEAAAASIASYQDKPTGSAPKAASHHKGSGGDTAPMRRKRGLANTEVSRNKVCVKAPVRVDAHDTKILSS
ncbi:hypothetical protein BGZ97_003120 [Linnemannia gamsii]|jgi:hypothetical protein|uniref:Uncharacterized protein n=1 Tax=Linnemannia gamsii TaxID=64522 RepID=A0A9P6UGS9_9FUNG|nr:hypothetical protein BGZ97_003120 [Linnemannia gamsii]